MALCNLCDALVKALFDRTLFPARISYRECFDQLFAHLPNVLELPISARTCGLCRVMMRAIIEETSVVSGRRYEHQSVEHNIEMFKTIFVPEPVFIAVYGKRPRDLDNASVASEQFHVSSLFVVLRESSKIFDGPHGRLGTLDACAIPGMMLYPPRLQSTDETLR